MNRQFIQDIVEPLTKVAGTDKTRVSLAMALAIGYALPVPNQGTEDAATWYQNEYRWKVQQFVGEFNERFLIDTTVVIDGAREVWLGRYRQCFVHDRQVMEDTLGGKTPAVVFLGQYEDSLRDQAVIAEAAFLLHGKIIPVILDMTNPGALVK